MTALSTAASEAEATDASDRVDHLSEVVVSRAEAHQALCRCILQIAKQGIAVIHSNKAACPMGRTVGNVPLKVVIWEGRNQSLHYEAGIFHPPVWSCFAALEDAFGAEFSLTANPQKNMSQSIIGMLGWADYQNYKLDMMTLLL